MSFALDPEDPTLVPSAIYRKRIEEYYRQIRRHCMRIGGRVFR